MCILKIFFFNDTATTEIYTLSLHDALPILRLRDELEVDRQRADPEALGEVLRLLDRPDVLDRGAGAAVDAVGVLLVVDRRQRDDLVVERDREALEVLLGRRALRDVRAARIDAGERLAVAAALRDAARDAREGLAALVR